MANAQNRKTPGEGTRRRLLRVAENQQKERERKRLWRAQEKERLHCYEQTINSQCNVESTSSAAALERSTTRHARKLAYELINETIEYGVEYQRLLMTKLLDQDILKPTLPERVTNKKKYLHCEAVCDNIARVWDTVKYGRGTEHFIARTVLQAAVVSDSSHVTSAGLSRCTGLNKISVAKGLQHRQMLDTNGGDGWGQFHRRKRKDALTDDIKDVVEQWWTDETRVSPKFDDVVYKRLGVKNSEEHARHFIEESQVDFYTRFIAAHSHLRIGLRTFTKLKPYFVYKLKDFNSCCCKYHQEMSEIKAAFNSMRSTSIHHGGATGSCNCSCDFICANPVNGSAVNGIVACCGTGHTFRRSADLWEKILCPRDSVSGWHKLRCIKSDCPVCGLSILPLCPRELSAENPTHMNWRCFEKVFAGQTRDGQQKQVTRLEPKRTAPHEFIDFALPKLKEFVLHNFVAQWQQKEYKKCVPDLREGELISLVDFAENYAFKWQNEIQEEHWFNFQISILVHITYRLNPGYDPLDKNTKRVLTEYYYYLSDDKKHDNLFVQRCFSRHWADLLARGIHIKRHTVWSDGCAAQFKSARPWFFVARYPSLTVSLLLPSGCSMEWHYWGSGHGKGPHDGAGACLKRAIRKEQLKSNGAKLQNARDVAAFLNTSMNQSHVAYDGARREVRQNIWEIEIGEVDRNRGYECRTISGSRSKHSICSVSHVNNTLLEVREFSCFCPHCVDSLHGMCPQRSHAEPWNLIVLEPCNASDALCDRDDRNTIAGGDGDVLAAQLKVGDTFAVRAEQPNVEKQLFYVLRCTKPMHVVTVDHVDDYGFRAEAGSDVVWGQYFKQKGRKKNSFVLDQDKGPAWIYSHLVRVANFPVTLSSHRQKGHVPVYNISERTLDTIKSVIEEDVELDKEDESCSGFDAVEDDSSDSDQEM